MSHSPPPPHEEPASWLLQDRECFERVSRAVNLSSLRAGPPLPLLLYFTPSFLPPPLPPLETQMGATVTLLAKVLHTCKMDQWFRDDGRMTVNYRWRRFLSTNPRPSITEWSFFRGAHQSSLLLLCVVVIFFFFCPPPSFSFDPAKQFAGNIVSLLGSNGRLCFIIGKR